MADPNDERLREALEQETFDLPRGEQLKAAFVRRFEMSRRKVLIHASAWLLVGLVILFGGAWLLGRADGTRLMLLGAVVMLIGYESTVLIKLWYWTVDTKIILLKEIKRVGLLTVEPESADESGQPERGQTSIEGHRGFWDRISTKRLQWALFIMLVVTGGVCGAVFLGPLFAKPGEPVEQAEYHVTVGADGSVRMVARTSGVYYGVTPVDVLDVYVGEAMRDAVWRDGRGNVLEADARQEEDGRHCLVRLGRTVFRGERIDLRVEWTESEGVKEENGTWTFTPGPAWRDGLRERHALTLYPRSLSRSGIRIVRTVTLPAGAVLESTTVRPKMQWRDGERLVLSFEGPGKGDGGQAFQVTYRLAPGAREE